MQGVSVATTRLLSRSPGEHDYLDFKEDSSSLSAGDIAAMANAAALAGESHATMLIGVGEKEDPRTGVVSGEIVGLSGDVHKLGEKIAQISSNTRPTPVRLGIFEENVSAKPILRVEITPTLPPHYDDKGRRATRQHRTTRAMSDQEMLELLQARAEHRFGPDTEDLMMGEFQVVRDELQRQGEQTAGEVVDRMDELWDPLSRPGRREW